MRPLPNFEFSALQTYSASLAEIEKQIRLLIEIIQECDEQFTEEDNKQLVTNIQWLKRFYEAAERNLLNGNR